MTDPKPRDVMYDVAVNAEGLAGGVMAQAHRARTEKPGTAYMKLPESTRRILRGLTSADVADIRWYR